MDRRPFMILVASHKGGVGKSIICLNIAAALRRAGYTVMLIDTDVANPSIAPLLGMRDPGTGFAEMIADGRLEAENALVAYVPGDFYFIPAGGKGQAIGLSDEHVNRFFMKMKKSNFDFVIVDTPPGMDLNSSLKLFDEALIVTLPEETAVFGAQRLSQLFSDHHLLHKLVINRMKNSAFELDKAKIEQLYGDVAYSMLPEDPLVIESEAKHTPAYMLNKQALFSIAIEDLCRSYSLKAGEPAQGEKLSRGPFHGLKKFFGFK